MYPVFIVNNTAFLVLLRIQPWTKTVLLPEVATASEIV